MKKLVLTLVVLLFAVSAHAETDSGYLKGPRAQKLKRGVANIITSPIELPKEIVDHWKASGSHPAQKTAYLVGGTVKGLVRFVSRLGSGVWDVVTFNLDVPKGYDSLVKPDYIFDEKVEK